MGQRYTFMSQSYGHPTLGDDERRDEVPPPEDLPTPKPYDADGTVVRCESTIE
ncbi:hypothetical protein E4U43_005267 [Claviceps pusilla]|uniref:Uncharacterized protein n=1 Tax=Claviceps pusilla TaxID=123648 RepID=A0A9P7N2A3_9HYPO|nr:hypothetical protein E4U43_005267 [Claviceps pusilla]